MNTGPITGVKTITVLITEAVLSIRSSSVCDNDLFRYKLSGLSAKVYIYFVIKNQHDNNYPAMSLL
jgi:hypothetical protein